MSKRQASKWERLEVEVFGWAWVVAWFAAIWFEPFRWPLFWTGAFCLVLGMLASAGHQDSSEPPTF